MATSVKIKNKTSGDNDMTLLETKIRTVLLNCLPEPKGCFKSDIILYKHKAGRVNFWHSVTNSDTFDIVSYYFTYNSSEISVYSDQKVVKMLKL